jgi:hypothetical protein
MKLEWHPEFRAYAFTHPLVAGMPFDLVPHMVTFGRQQKFLFTSQSQAHAWKRLCGKDNSLAWAKEDAAMWGDNSPACAMEDAIWIEN